MKSECVLSYNRLMGDVDHSDQLATNHRSARKSIKWYKKLFFYLYSTLVNRPRRLPRPWPTNVAPVLTIRMAGSAMAHDTRKYQSRPESAHLSPIMARMSFNSRREPYSQERPRHSGSTKHISARGV